MNRGQLIVIDGIDGSGKSTQAKILIETLKQHGQAVEFFKFPNYTSYFGHMIKQYLNNEFGPATKIDPRLASLLYAADRWQASEQIKDWLAQGKTVVLDRYYTANLIHQAAKLPEEKLDEFVGWLQALEFETFKIPKPDLVIFLHVNAQTSFDLITSRGEGHDGHDTLEHLRTAEQRCLHMAKMLGWRTIECTPNKTLLDVNAVAALIWQTVEPELTH